ncbi:MAG TPA: transcriptional regulator GcvA [Stellaceae bacterium]|nr:transcriptional regulator GcvA [Stellaceae bacterium]
MSRRLPPLNALRAFEAAARNGSFLLAADELGLTAGAISYQIKSLEAQLGISLFRRLSRGVALTEAGGVYHAHVRDAFDRLGAATDALLGRHKSHAIRITALPAFAEKWLVPRLLGFHERHPDIELSLSADAELVDFVTGDFDIGLRYSDGRHPALHVSKLMSETLFPVCSPAFAAERALHHPADLAAHTLVYDTHWRDDWALWFEAAGLRGIDVTAGPAFTLYSMALEAAMKGLGIAMGHSALVADDLAAKRLVAPFELRIEAPRAYYVVSPNWTAANEAVAAFKTWLMGEISRSETMAEARSTRTFETTPP